MVAQTGFKLDLNPGFGPGLSPVQDLGLTVAETVTASEITECRIRHSEQ